MLRSSVDILFLDFIRRLPLDVNRAVHTELMLSLHAVVETIVEVVSNETTSAVDFQCDDLHDAFLLAFFTCRVSTIRAIVKRCCSTPFMLIRPVMSTWYIVPGDVTRNAGVPFPALMMRRALMPCPPAGPRPSPYGGAS